MRTLKTLAIAALLITSLSGCSVFESRQEISMLNKAQAGGAPFTQQLTSEYRNFANYLHDSMDNADAIHFSRKGMDAAQGREVLPESVSDWNVPLQSVREFAESRARLINAYDLGAKELAPQIAAVAQARFDCWIEQVESSWAFGDDRDASCKQQFMDAMGQLDQALAGRQRPMPAPAMPAPMPEPAPYVPAGPLQNADALYLVFFDWDKSQIGEGGINVIDAAADASKGRQYNTLRVVGHTDTSGEDGYNDALSAKRAAAVKEALTQRGIAVDKVVTESRGEREPMVQTGDGVREPANRRATITFE